VMDSYELGNSPTRKQRSPERIMREIGQHPYRAKQPNGWSDFSEDWMSPELLIRRLVYAQLSYSYINVKSRENYDKFYHDIVVKNFDNPNNIMKYLNKKERFIEKHTLLFNHPEFLRS